MRQLLFVIIIAGSISLSACSGGGSAPMLPSPGNGTDPSAPGASANATQRLFVPVLENDIIGFDTNANGAVPPLFSFTGTVGCRVGAPKDVAVDASGNIYVSNAELDNVEIFRLSANDDVSLVGVIQGPATGLSGPVGIALDSDGNLYVANFLAQSITKYRAGSVGNVAPIATITGTNTGLDFSVDNKRILGFTFDGAALATDSHGDVFVTTGHTFSTTFPQPVPAILEFSPEANGNVAPIARIMAIGAPEGIAIDRSDRIYVTYVFSDLIPTPIGHGTVAVFAPGSNGNASPIAVINGPNTGLATSHSDEGIAVDATGRIFVANTDQYRIFVFAPGANGNVAPIATIERAFPQNQLAFPQLLTVH